MFDHLGLMQWPFVVVPEPKLCTFIASMWTSLNGRGTTTRNHAEIGVLLLPTWPPASRQADLAVVSYEQL